MVSLEKKRAETIKQLIDWLRQQFPNVLEELRSDEYWDSEAMCHLSFDQLDKHKQAVLIGRKLRDVLETFIRQNYTWSRMTENSYVSVVLSRLGCIRQKSVWLCPLKPKESKESKA